MEKIVVKTKSQLAYENLRTGISDGLLKPGERLVIQAISQEYGISDIPVREALKKLEAEGFVQSTPHMGFVVSKPNFQEQSEIFEVRRILECRAAELAAEHLTPEALSDLEKYHEKMRELCETDLVEFSHFNAKFHDTIYASCGNQFLYNLICRAWDLTSRTRSIFTLVPGRARSSINDHGKIYLALKARDGIAAGKAMGEHQTVAFELLSRMSNV